MNEFLSAISGTVLGAGASAAVIWTLLRYAIVKRIDQHFEKFKLLAESQIELQRKAAAAHVDQELAIYPALSQLVYQAKLGAEAAFSARNPFDVVGPDLINACRELTTRLVTYRIYLSPTVFGLLHSYKHTIQDIIVIADVLTRPGSADPELRIPDDAERRLANLISKSVAQSEEILTVLQRRMTHLQGTIRAQQTS